MAHARIFVLALLVFLGFSPSSAGPGTFGDQKPANQCSAAEPFSYDYGPAGQQNWCGTCSDQTVLQAPINISNTRESAQPAITFIDYNAPTNLVIYPGNLYNLKVDYKKGTSKIRIGNETFKLVEFHFHRPSEEAIDNLRFPMVLHLVHLNERAGCQIGIAGCVAVIAVLIQQGSSPAPSTSRLLDILFNHFPPPTGDQGVQISVEGLLPAGYENAGYWRYDGSLTTPPCTGNITFYLLKPLLTFSAEQIAEFERRYPTPNARDIQPLNGRQIVNKK
jgi:carbonic anhydrase